MTKKDGAKHIISVTAGVKIPPVDSFAAGYRAGAKKCVPGTQVQVGYSQDFIAQDKCKAIAQQPDRGRLARRLQRRRPLRSRRPRGGEGAGRLGRRRRRRPGLPRLAHPDERREEGGPGGLSARSRRPRTGRSSAAATSSFNLKNGGVALGKINSKVPASFKAKLECVEGADHLPGKIVPPASL